MSVHDEEGFARVYDEDDMLEVRKGDLRALLDVASTSMDFASGFMNDEEVEILRKTAETLGVDPNTVTPANHICKYQPHKMIWFRPISSTFYNKAYAGYWRCPLCGLEDHEKAAPETPPGITLG